MDADFNLENSKDIRFCTFYILIGIFALLTLTVINQNQSLQSAVQIYTSLFWATTLLILFAIVLGKNNPYFSLRVFGKEESQASNEGRILIGMFIGLVVGLLIVTSFKSIFQLNFIPQALATTSDTSTIFFLLFIGPIAETLLFIGVLVPTFKKLIKKLHMPFFFVLFATIIAGLSAFYSIAFILVGFAVLFFFVKGLDEFVINNLAVLAFVAILFSAIAFGIYHTKAYSSQANPQTDIISAILFGIACGYLMEYSGTLITAIAAHVAANASTYFQQNPSSLLIVLLTVTAFVALTLLAYGFNRKIKFQQIQSLPIIGRG